MNITLWILQVLLALAFLAHGIMLLTPPPEVAVLMNAMLPRWFQVFLGVAEVLAAVGLTAARTDPHPPRTRTRGGRRDHDRDGLGDGSASVTSRTELGGDDLRALADGRGSGLRTAAAADRSAPGRDEPLTG